MRKAMQWRLSDSEKAFLKEAAEASNIPMLTTWARFSLIVLAEKILRRKFKEIEN